MILYTNSRIVPNIVIETQYINVTTQKIETSHRIVTLEWIETKEMRLK